MTAPTAAQHTRSPLLRRGRPHMTLGTRAGSPLGVWKPVLRRHAPGRPGCSGPTPADPVCRNQQKWRRQETPCLRLCRSRSTKNKTAIGSRGWFNAALARRYRARRVRSRCGTLQHAGFASLACRSPNTFSFFLVFLAIRRADGLLGSCGRRTRRRRRVREVTRLKASKLLLVQLGCRGSGHCLRRMGLLSLIVR